MSQLFNCHKLNTGICHVITKCFFKTWHGRCKHWNLQCFPARAETKFGCFLVFWVALKTAGHQMKRPEPFLSIASSTPGSENGWTFSGFYQRQWCRNFAKKKNSWLRGITQRQVRPCWVNMGFLSFLWGISSAASLFVLPFAYSCTLREWASESISQSKFKNGTQVYILELKKCPKNFNNGPFIQHLLSFWFWFIIILIFLPSH